MIKRSIHNILLSLEKKYKFVNIELSLGLPFGTLKSWKNHKKISPEGKALLKIINMQPNLFIRVAANNFKNANNILVDEMIVKPTKLKEEKISRSSKKDT